MSEGKLVVLLGDFNCDLLQQNSKGNKLQVITAEYGLAQLIREPTRATENSSTLIDLFFSSEDDRQAGNTVADLGFHEGGFVRSDALAHPRKFLETMPTSSQKPRPLHS